VPVLLNAIRPRRSCGDHPTQPPYYRYNQFGLLLSVSSQVVRHRLFGHSSTPCFFAQSPCQSDRIRADMVPPVCCSIHCTKRANFCRLRGTWTGSVARVFVFSRRRLACKTAPRLPRVFCMNSSSSCTHGHTHRLKYPDDETIHPPYLRGRPGPSDAQPGTRESSAKWQLGRALSSCGQWTVALADSEGACGTRPARVQKGRDCTGSVLSSRPAGFF